MEMLKKVDISAFKKKKPPSDGSYTTHTELNELRKIPLNKSHLVIDKPESVSLVNPPTMIIIEIIQNIVINQ